MALIEGSMPHRSLARHTASEDLMPRGRLVQHTASRRDLELSVMMVYQMCQSALREEEDELDSFSFSDPVGDGPGSCQLMPRLCPVVLEYIPLLASGLGEKVW